MSKVIAQGIGAAVLAASVILVPALVGPPSFTAARAACEPGDVVDATTAQQAKQRAESAGFTGVRMVRKGCDNTWHGTGMKGGAAVNIAVSASGQVNQEGD
ncbi:MAG TPA: hypothetical protein VJN67_03770 [Stellaceae bacterium]|nr:hypothetical protein [Stellaceae bacterium]